MTHSIGIIGDGGWGTAIALLLARHGHRVFLWGPFGDYLEEMRRTRENRKFLPGHRIPEGIELTDDPAVCARGRDAVVSAVPSPYVADVLERFRGLVPTEAVVVSVTKGLDRESSRRMSVIAEERLGHRPIAVLSGPSFAEEVASGMPTAVSLACEDERVAKFLQSLFSGDSFRVYTSRDVIGVELGGALKNVMALAAGIGDGLGLGHNPKAALLTRGLAEMRRLGAALGARPETFSGLSGMGDLILTCTGGLSRNRAVGERIGRGEKAENILAEMEQVAEGVTNCRHVVRLSREIGVEAPIAAAVAAILDGAITPRDAVRELLSRDLRAEEPFTDR
jgi:glycerol-3-phosphate dehydrogenase (NAD(P)+)